MRNQLMKKILKVFYVQSRDSNEVAFDVYGNFFVKISFGSFGA